MPDQKEDIGLRRREELLGKIRALMQSYGKGGVVTIADEHGMTYGIELPDWALIELRPSGEVILKIRQAQPEETDATLHFILATRDACRFYADSLNGLEEYLRKHFVLEHKNQMPGPPGGRRH